MFSNAARNRFPATHWVLLERLTALVATLRDAQDDEASFPQTTDPVGHFNAYIDFGLSVYSAKLLQLFETLEHALEHERYLVYAQSGRAILENVATIRYYSRHADFVAVQHAWASSSLTDMALRKANETLDRFVRGNRFAWDAFIEGRSQDFTSTPHQPHLAQISSITCLSKWFKDAPTLKPLYDVLCDLVHPNVGSNLLVLGLREGKLVATSPAAPTTALFIVAPTLAGLLSTFKEFEASVSAFASLQLMPKPDSRPQ